MERYNKHLVVLSAYQCYKNHSNENWDGFGANSIKSDVYKNLKRFVDRLPDIVVMPEVVPEPCGTICLDWYSDKGYISVSFNENSKMTFLCCENGNITTHIFDN